MTGIIKIVLTAAVLTMIGFFGWWYGTTPQPQGLAAQWGYLEDTVLFQTKYFTRLPDFKNEHLQENEVTYWLAKAEQGNNVARIAIAQYLFVKGPTNPVAYQRATFFLDPAAKAGIPLAQNALGVAYRHGLGVTQDKIEAAKWFKLAAQRGLGLAEQNLYQIAKSLTAEDLQEIDRRVSIFQQTLR